ncbi:ABC transporter substrate-binding protein [Tistrella bauzanensis]|uniref:ABC transporter substrate-binding protein n=1 Tax=Tistrella bauzanensis TaxID=657419 RepID=A0ABQ1IQ83_9PROT|nr:ABC transporter substrate-binding protein [Tistrella bauzanensis]GGB48283.1 ABC transporter substrate-binding protein [Tistrella bauzanensis]
MTLSRRSLLAGLGCLSFLPQVVSASRAGQGAGDAISPRVVALDWSSAETLIMLGLPPVGIVRIPDYKAWVVEPALPAGVVDVGLRLEPNLEVMQQLAPDLIVIAPGLETVRARLEQVAPTVSLTIYGTGQEAFPAAVAETRRLGTLVGCSTEAEDYLARAARQIDRARDRLRGYDGRPVHVVNFLDDRHVRVFGTTSLWQHALGRLGLRNAWTGDSGPWGSVTVGIERLLSDPEARLVHVAPAPEGVVARLRTSPLWRHLPAIADGRMVGLPAVFPFGAVPCTVRFADCLSLALGGGADKSSTTEGRGA